MRIHHDANMSIHKTTYMRIHLDANMSFHKDRQSPPIIEATGVGSLSLPSSHQVSSLNARTGTRRGRAVHNQAVTSVPGFGPARRAPERRGQRHHAPARPHTLPIATARLSRRRHKRKPWNPEPLAGNDNQALSCPP